MTSPRENKVWTRPLRVHLSFIITGFLVLVSTALISFNYVQGRRGGIADAAHAMQIFADRIAERYRVLAADAVSLLGLATVDQVFVPPPSDRLDEKVRLLSRAAIQSRYIDGIYVGYPTGAFIHVVSLTRNGAWREVLKPPANASFAVRVIEAGHGVERLSRWEFRSPEGALLGSQPAEVTEYDPRKRPWYQAALTRSGVVATEPYRMSTTGAAGITIARSHRENARIVIGADLLLDTVEDFLATARIAPSSRVFVFDQDGRLVAPTGQPDYQPGQLTSSTSAPDLVQRVAPLLKRAVDTAEALRLHASGRDYLVEIVPIKDTPLFNGGRIAVLAPVDELTAPSNRLLRRNLLISASVLLLGIGGSLLISRRLSRPLGVLTAEADRLRNLDFNRTPALQTWVSEIRQLGEALAKAREAIHAFGLYVPKEIVRRIVAQDGFAGRVASRDIVTALFTDIADFTTICERHRPEDVVAMLSAYFDLFSRAVQDHRGVIVQFAGDGVFAMWNAPISNPRHAEDACRCCLQLKKSLNLMPSRLDMEGRHSRRGSACIPGQPLLERSVPTTGFNTQPWATASMSPLGLKVSTSSFARQY